MFNPDAWYHHDIKNSRRQNAFFENKVNHTIPTPFRDGNVKKTFIVCRSCSNGSMHERWESHKMHEILLTFLCFDLLLHNMIFSNEFERMFQFLFFCIYMHDECFLYLTCYFTNNKSLLPPLHFPNF